MMPELDGYGVIAALRADTETIAIPFIFLTAKGEKPDIRAGMNLGADDYLTIPVAKPDLLDAIRSRLERAIQQAVPELDRKSTRLNSSHTVISYAVFCLKKKKTL